MAPAVAGALLDAFLEVSYPSVNQLARSLPEAERRPRAPVELFRFEGPNRHAVPVPAGTFLLRTSVEYANPQVTLEELQGILLARLLEVAGPFARDHPNSPPSAADRRELARQLREPPRGPVVPFVMNVDDIEADRYSVNPLRSSIVASGQSARAVADVQCEGLAVDRAFVEKYRGTLVSDRDLSAIEAELTARGSASYVDLVDRVKYRQLGELSELLGIDVAIPAFRMPISTLRAETTQGPLHRLVSAAHRDLATLRALYALFGREFGRRKTLLPAVPHGPGGLASKRLSRGRLLVDADRLLGVEVHYSSGPLYPNEVDTTDVAKAVADGFLLVEPDRLTSYDFRRTPASPQFALYMLASPEDGAIWHGVGKYAGVQIVESYTAFHRAARLERLFGDVPLDCPADPPQWDLVAEGILAHPISGNIDASVTLVDDLPALLPRHARLRPLSVAEGAREAAPGVQP